MPVVSMPHHWCTGQLHTASVSPSGMIGTWSTGSASVASVINTTTGVFLGTYNGATSSSVSIIFTSAAGCKDSTRARVFQVPNVHLTSLRGYYCSAADTLTAYITGPTSNAYSYIFTPSSGLSSAGGVSATPATYSYTTAATPGATTIYTVAATDTNGCMNTATLKVVVPCDNFCSIAGGAITVLNPGISGNIPTGYYGTGYYYVDNSAPSATVTGAGAITFVGAVVAVGPGVSVDIPNLKDAYIYASHFFCCENDTMWKGFRVLTSGSGGSATTGTIRVEQNSLIEDAEVAIDAAGPSVSSTYSASGAHIVTTLSSIFNRNKIGIRISTYAPAVTVYPFVIDKTIFTSRDMSGYYSGSALTYPSAWPNASDLTAYYNPGPTVKAHLNIDNPNGKPISSSSFAPYSFIGCKTHTAYLNAETGITLLSVGPTAPTGGTYYGMEVVSDGTPSDSLAGGGVFNPFDNLNYGIYASASNLIVKGAWFTHLHPKTTLSGEGIGVFSISSSSYDTRLQVNPSVTGLPLNDKNYFYNCKTGVRSYENNKVNCSYNNLYSDHLASAYDTTIGDFGYLVTASPRASMVLNVATTWSI